MTDISLEKASLVALWVESILYGGYVVLFAICVHILAYGARRNKAVNKPLLLSAILMFIMCTIHIVVVLVRAIQAFISSATLPGGALGYYAQIWTGLSIFKQALYATNNVVADGLVVYRCYVVWGFSWKIIVFPIIMLIATTVCGYIAVYNFSQIVPGEDVFASNIAEWGTALFSLSLATNVIVTSLIAGRIWWLARRTQSQLGSKHNQKYNNAVALILESGAIYSVSLMTLLILYCLQTNAQYIVYDALAQIMGIVPTLIIVRVGLGVSTQEPSGPAYVGAKSTHGVSSLPHYRHQPVALQVRKVVEVDADVDGRPMSDTGALKSSYHSDNYFP